MTPLIRSALTFASALKPQRLSILIFHRVLAQHDALMPGEPDVKEFDRLMRVIAQSFQVLPLGEAQQRLAAGSLPPRALCITFDDGYADNAEIALPILLSHGLPATFFIATAFLDGGRMWNDSVIETLRRASGTTLDLRDMGLEQYAIQDIPARRQAIEKILNALKYLPLAQRSQSVEALVAHIGASLPDNLMLRADQVRDLRRAGMEIGGHTQTHPILARLDREAAHAEMQAGKSGLEEILGEPVTLFAYPNGKPDQDYSVDHVQLARELGFECAVSTAWGSAHGHSDRFQLPRFTPWEKTPERFVLRLIQNLFRAQTQFAH